MALPQEALGQGFLSRVILVYSDPTARITFPRTPDEGEMQGIADKLAACSRLRGVMDFTPEARQMIDDIYQTAKPLDDVRFQYYHSRRLNQIFKLCMILAVLDESLLMTANHVLEANTLLTYTELSMEKALGEFGKNALQAATSKVLQALELHDRPLTIEELYKAASSDLNRFTDMTTLLANLVRAGKIQTSDGFFILKKKQLNAGAVHVDLAKFIPEYTSMGAQ